MMTDTDRVMAAMEILQDASARIVMHGISQAEAAQAHLEWGIAGLAKHLTYEQFLSVITEAGVRFYASRLQLEGGTRQ